MLLYLKLNIQSIRGGSSAELKTLTDFSNTERVWKMKKALYTFLLWNLFLFAAGLNDLVFYRNVTLSEGVAMVDWAQPAFASVTLFLLLLSIYYGLHQLLFGKNFYLKLEANQEDLDKMRDSIFAFMKKEKINPEKLQQHLKYLIIAEVVLWGVFIVYLFISRGY